MRLPNRKQARLHGIDTRETVLKDEVILYPRQTVSRELD